MMFDVLGRPRGAAALATVSAIAIMAAFEPASAQEQQRSFNIPAQALSTALIEFSRQSNVMVVADPAVVRGHAAPMVRGDFTPRDALGQLVTGSGLNINQRPEGGFVLVGDARPTRTGAADPAASEDVDIVVTARKREESLQNVPAAVTALGGATLSHMGAEGFDDFVRLAPGLTMAPTSLVSNFSIRGISTSNAVGTTQTPISLYVDETQTEDVFVPLSTFNLYLADINRVEVLRGPQGTLFGSGSLSGAIRVITNKPDPTAFSGYVQGGVTSIEGGDPGTQVEGVINAPLGSATAVRALLYDRRFGGYIDNTLRHEDNTNGTRSTGGRVALRSDLTSTLSATGTVIYQLDRDDDGSRSFYTPSQGGSRQWESLVSDTTRVGNWIGNILVTDDLGWATLTSSTSYLRKKEQTQLDASPDLGLLLGVPGTPVWGNTYNHSEDVTQELRLNSQGSGPISYVIGAYYSHAHRFTESINHSPVLEGLIGQPNILDARLNTKVKEAALFGEVTWAFAPNWDVAAGVRVFHNEFDVGVNNSGLLIGPPVQLSRVNRDDSSTPRFTLSWHPDEDVTLYAQAAKGYRLGQANIAAGPPLYNSDTLWNYEVGAKGEYFDHRLLLNVAAFYIDWQNLQIGLRQPATLFFYTGNAGSARSVGLEVEADWRFTHELDFHTSMAFTDAELTQSIPNVPQPSGVLGVKDGDRLPGAPRFTISNALSYRRDLGDGATLRLRLDHQYVGRSYNTFTRAGALVIGDYNIFNFSGGVGFDHFDIDLFVKNIGDSDGVTNANFDYGADVLRAAWRVPPRSIGVSVRRSF
jgi:outer membrane receptor protein involved in Fe transport